MVRLVAELAPIFARLFVLARNEPSHRLEGVRQEGKTRRRDFLPWVVQPQVHAKVKSLFGFLYEFHMNRVVGYRDVIPVRPSLSGWTGGAFRGMGMHWYPAGVC